MGIVREKLCSMCRREAKAALRRGEPAPAPRLATIVIGGFAGGRGEQRLDVPKYVCAAHYGELHDAVTALGGRLVGCRFVQQQGRYTLPGAPIPETMPVADLVAVGDQDADPTE